VAKTDDPLDELVSTVLKSQKYNRVCEDVVRRVGTVELGKRRNLKEAIKASKNKLHQIGGAYLDDSLHYAAWSRALAEAASAGQEALRVACWEIMSHHASTKERLAILDEFYAAVLADLAPIHSVLDIACGLNPLAIPWMPLAPGAAYYAYDIYHDMIGFLNTFWPLVGIEGHAFARDIGPFIPSEPVDVALVLKTIPCLEQVDKSAGLRLLENLNAAHMVVSFPARSLGGHDKGMVENYEARLRTLLEQKEWPVRRFEFATELAFVITKK
jgi:16S rRNA (guanine(1405)-N(7))-methyltransferase